MRRSCTDPSSSFVSDTCECTHASNVKMWHDSCEPCQPHCTYPKKRIVVAFTTLLAVCLTSETDLFEQDAPASSTWPACFNLLNNLHDTDDYCQIVRERSDDCRNTTGENHTLTRRCTSRSVKLPRNETTTMQMPTMDHGGSFVSCTNNSERMIKITILKLPATATKTEVVR